MATKNNEINNFESQTLNKLGQPADLIFRHHLFNQTYVCICFLKDIVKHEQIADFIIKPLCNTPQNTSINNLKNQFLYSATCKEIVEDEVCQYLLLGHTILFINKKNIIAFDTTLFPKRTIAEPPTSAVLKGPRSGFVDDVVTNMSLLRKHIKSPNFHFKEFLVGSQTQTKVCVAYLNNIANKKIVQRVCTLVKNIKIDGVVDSYYIAQYISKNPYSMFTQVGSCEKPDIATARMLEGRIAILVDNSPIVLTVPFMLLEDLQNSNDYYQNYTFSSFIRLIRTFGVFLATVAPGIYLALRLFHYKLIPFKFLVTISNSTQGLPLTPFLELFFILILFELLYEVSLRLPQYLGLATSIVGALILGDTGVSAGLISPPAVMIVALSIISIYTMPDQRGQLSLLRFVFVLLGAMFGIVGIVIGILIVISELCKLESFSVAYLAPFAPYDKQDFKDSILKKSIISQNTMPNSLKTQTQKRSQKE